MINLLKRIFCNHRYIPRYMGLTVTGFVCVDCEKRKYERHSACRSSSDIINQELAWLDKVES